MNLPMDLVKKDLYLYEIEDQIKLRRNLILEKNKDDRDGLGSYSFSSGLEPAL